MTFIEKFEQFIDSYKTILKDDKNLSEKEIFSPFTISLRTSALYFIPCIKKAKLSPNNLTTLGLLFNAFAIYNLLNHEFAIFIFLTLSSFYCDIINRVYATKDNLNTKFAEKYFIIGMWIKLISITGIIYALYYRKITYPIILLIFIIFMLGNLHYSIESMLEKRLNPSKKTFILFWDVLFKKKSDDELKKILKFTRYFDDIMTLLYCAIIVIYINNH
jgi:hypothetical protein